MNLGLDFKHLVVMYGKAPCCMQHHLPQQIEFATIPKPTMTTQEKGKQSLEKQRATTREYNKCHTSNAKESYKNWS